jgi:hypothetical protein
VRTGSVTRSPDSQRFALRAGRGGPTSPVAGWLFAWRFPRCAFQRLVVTPIRGQSVLTGQTEQRGEIGAQMFWPNETSRSL